MDFHGGNLGHGVFCLVRVVVSDDADVIRNPEAGLVDGLDGPPGPDGR